MKLLVIGHYDGFMVYTIGFKDPTKDNNLWYIYFNGKIEDTPIIDKWDKTL